MQDHFPRFPIMPGVLMVEALFQAGMWLVRSSSDFAFSSVALRQTKSLTFRDFVQPGNSLEVTGVIKKVDGSLTTLQMNGTIGGNPAVKGRLELDMFNLAEREGVDSAVDAHMNQQFKIQFRQLCSQMEKTRRQELMPSMGD